VKVKTNLAQRKEIFSRLEYKPSVEQEVIHFSDIARELKVKHVVGGEQSGKSYCTAKECISRIPEVITGNRLIWFGGLDYDDCRMEFEYFIEDARALGLMEKYTFPNEGPCTADLLGGVSVKTRSFKDITKIGRESPDIIAVCEATRCSWNVIERCITRVGASKGYVMLSGTMEGSLTWAAEKYKEWQSVNQEMAMSFSLPSWTNLHRYPSGRDDPQIIYFENTLPDDVFKERLGGVPCPVSELIIKDFRNEIHVGDFHHIPDVPVEIAIDPGGSHKSGAYSVLAIQVLEGIPYVIDEVYLRGYVTEEIIDPICINKPWWKEVTGGVIDVAAKQHSTAAPKEMTSDMEIWWEKTRIPLTSSRIEVGDGIDRLRGFMKIDPITGKPGMFIDSKCKGLISECGGGKSPIYDGGAWLRDKNTMHPLDKNNHSCKALYYWLIDRYGFISIERGEALTVVSHSPFR